MFFTVKFGADQEELFNSDCGLKLLIDSMIRRCNFPPDAAIGLADERCNVINLVEQNSDLTTCTSLLTERGVYTLVAIYSQESGHSKYKALLENVDPELALKLEALSNPQAVENKGATFKSKLKSKISLTTSSRTRKMSVSRTGRASRNI